MKKTGLFDVRTIIGALLTLYGLVLLVASFNTSASDKAKADGINANLWMGLVLLVFGVLMIVWAVTRPIVVDEEQLEADKREVQEEAQRRREAGPAT
jgi:TRAP-type C4-dicarboxylate transport system permease small subunit